MSKWESPEERYNKFFDNEIFKTPITLFGYNYDDLKYDKMIFDNINFKLYNNQAEIYETAININNNFQDIIDDLKFIKSDVLESFKFKSSHYDFINNNHTNIPYRKTNVTLSTINKFKLYKLINNILYKLELDKKYQSYIDNNNYHVYIQTIKNYELAPEVNNRKIHLVVKPEYHIFTLIMLIACFKNEGEELVLKTTMNYYEWQITSNEKNKNNNEVQQYLKYGGREPSIVIYAKNHNDFIDKLLKIINIFKNFSKIIGLDLPQSYNIRINELIYYGIGTRVIKLNRIEALAKNCLNVDNFNDNKFSEDGKILWEGCRNQTTEGCMKYSNSEPVKRMSGEKPMCEIDLTNGKCIPRPLESCYPNVFYSNKEQLNKNEKMCIDELCLQDYEFGISFDEMGELKLKKEYEHKQKLINPQDYKKFSNGLIPSIEEDLKTKLLNSDKKYMKYKKKYMKIKKNL